MAEQKTEPTGAATKRVVVITREIDAPREQIFQAWIDPTQFARWWGPKNFTNPVCEIDARSDGALNIVMRSPDGVDYPMTGKFQAVVKPARIAFSAIARDHANNPLLEALTVVTFDEIGRRTRITVQASAVGLAPLAAKMVDGMEAGWTQSLEKLRDLFAGK
jgi:uncharacterized protein YndB with AHSA1/START domain